MSLILESCNAVVSEARSTLGREWLQYECQVSLVGGFEWRYNVDAELHESGSWRVWHPRTYVSSATGALNFEALTGRLFDWGILAENKRFTSVQLDKWVPIPEALLDQTQYETDPNVFLAELRRRELADALEPLRGHYLRAMTNMWESGQETDFNNQWFLLQNYADCIAGWESSV